MREVLDKTAEDLRDSEIGVVTYDVQRILLPTDGSATALEAMDVAIGIAKRFGAEIVAMFVDAAAVKRRPSAGSREAEIGQDGEPGASSDGSGLAVAAKAGMKNGVTVTQVVERGSVPARIIETARDRNCDLIVIGDTGRSGHRRSALGTVAEAVLQKAQVPVMVVKHCSTDFCISKRP